MSDHFDAFHSLEAEKKERIINAALDEIASKGFKKASTNAIVEKAGISKGTLFYYFGSKEELFDFLCDYALEFAKREYVDKFEEHMKTGDFIERQKIRAELKRQLMSAHPRVAKFYESFFIPGNAEYLKKYTETINETREIVGKSVYENIDYSLFRDDIGHGKIMGYMQWLFESYEKEITDRLVAAGAESIDMENMFREFNEFLNDLRKMFYKEGLA